MILEHWFCTLRAALEHCGVIVADRHCRSLACASTLRDCFCYFVKIMFCVDKYAPSKRWQIDTLITMLSIAGQSCDPAIGSNTIMYIGQADELQVFLTLPVLPTRSFISCALLFPPPGLRDAQTLLPARG